MSNLLKTFMLMAVKYIHVHMVIFLSIISVHFFPLSVKQYPSDAILIKQPSHLRYCSQLACLVSGVISLLMLYFRLVMSRTVATVPASAHHTFQADDAWATCKPIVLYCTYPCTQYYALFIVTFYCFILELCAYRTGHGEFKLKFRSIESPWIGKVLEAVLMNTSYLPM